MAMELLFTLDEGDYDDNMPVNERFAVRAVIVRDGMLAMQKSAGGEYKLPGGGMEPGETLVQALCREVAEETGLTIDTNSLAEIGEVLELRRDIFDSQRRYISHSMYFRCDITGKTVATAMSESEKKAGYQLVWERPETIYAENVRMNARPWAMRDTRLIMMLMGRDTALQTSCAAR